MTMKIRSAFTLVVWALMALALSVIALLVPGPVHAQKLAQPSTLRTANLRNLECSQTGVRRKPPSSARASQLSLVFDYITAHDQEPDRDYYAGQIDLTEGIDAAEVATWM